LELQERISRYRAIEAHRTRPLIAYATSTRIGVSGQMAGDAVRQFIDQIDCITNSDKVDILLHSTGGDALTAWKLMSILRERFTSVAVLVPYMAFSAATIFALGADEIVMHPHASLGPIDPQIRMAQKDGTARQFAYEDVGAFLRFLATEVRITEQAHVSAVIEKLFSVVDPVNVGAAKRASELASAVGERLLRMHMKDSEEKTRAREIAENLNKSFFAHADAVSRTRATELQLKIAKEDVNCSKLIWEAFLGLEGYMELRKSFNPLHHYLSDPAGAQALKPKNVVSLPANTPPAVAQQVWQAVANQAMQSAVEIGYSVVNAIIESPRRASEYRTSGTLIGSRNVNGEIQISITESSNGWNNLEVPQHGASDPTAPLLS
jgi:hypothetical protein